MTDQPSNNSLQDKILEAIKSGEVKSKSKWYFYGQSAALAMGLILTGLVLLFLGSLIVFSLQQNGAVFVASFGFYGLRILIMSLPWVLIIAVATLLVLLERLLKRYKFSYKQPMLYSFVGIGLLFTVGIIFISRVHIHEELFEQTRMHKTMLGEPFYRRYGMPPKGDVTQGIVFLVNEPGCKIMTLSDEELQVLITSKTRLPYNYNCTVGDAIMVLGPRDEDSINALGIIKINNIFYKTFTVPTPPIMTQPQIIQ